LIPLSSYLFLLSFLFSADVSFFFFQCYCHHRDLHSFPTRRSSDLYLGKFLCKFRQLPLQVDFRPARVSRRGRRGRFWRPETASADRKSTRLNSSHVKISYAVFCLKKKKRNIVESHMLIVLTHHAMI